MGLKRQELKASEDKELTFEVKEEGESVGKHGPLTTSHTITYGLLRVCGPGFVGFRGTGTNKYTCARSSCGLRVHTYTNIYSLFTGPNSKLTYQVFKIVNNPSFHETFLQNMNELLSTGMVNDLQFPQNKANRSHKLTLLVL